MNIIEEWREEAKRAFSLFLKTNNKRFLSIVVNCYLDIIRLTKGEDVYENYYRWYNSGDWQKDEIFNNAIHELNLNELIK